MGSRSRFRSRGGQISGRASSGVVGRGGLEPPASEVTAARHRQEHDRDVNFTTNQPADLIRKAYEAYSRGDVAAMLRSVDPDLEWTFLDPSLEDPEPQVCHGRHELKKALQRQAEQGLQAELEEVSAHGDRVMVVVRIPGVDALRARKADDRNYAVFTVRGGKIIALRDCRDRKEAMAAAIA